ncbi:MAG: hypothetical protein RLZZ59_713, partial [Pseudomonadota bacterium]
MLANYLHNFFSSKKEIKSRDFFEFASGIEGQSHVTGVSSYKQNVI